MINMQQKIDLCIKVLGDRLGAKKCMYDSINEVYTFYITSMSEGDYDTTTYIVSKADLIKRIERN